MIFTSVNTRLTLIFYSNRSFSIVFNDFETDKNYNKLRPNSSIRNGETTLNTV